jgi:tetratricopeptide (TPR) repeat protein
MINSGSPGRRGTRLCIVAAALGGFVYLNALHNPFVYDDHRTILDNGSIRSLREPRAIVLHDVTRPLVNLSYAIDRALWGGDPFGFHLTSVLLHIINVVLLFWIVWQLMDDRRSRGVQGALPVSPDAAAFAAAALFAVHPMMTEAVGYISGRSDVLCGALFLAGFICGRRWMRERGMRWWLLTVGFWIAALLAKEIAIMLPVVLFCYDWLILESDAIERRRTLRMLHVPLVGLALLAGIVRTAVFAYVERSGEVTIEWREVLGQAGVIWRYAGLILVPGGQTIFHDVPPIQTAFEPRALIAFVALVAIVTLAWRARRADAAARFGVIWFVLLLVPAAVLITIDDSQPMAEHRAYLASCGLFLTAGSLIAWCGARLSRVSARLRFLFVAALAVVLLSLGARTMLRNAVWGDPVALWREAADKAPKNWRPRSVLGEALHAAGRHEEAIVAYRTALALNPRDDMEYVKLALCLSELGRADEAAATFETLRRLDPQSPTVSTGLGAVAMMAGDPVRARRYFMETLDKDPRNVMALQWLAVLEEDVAGNPAEALRRCEELQRLMPGSLSTEDCVRRNRLRVGVR